MRWENRIERARELQERHPAAAEAMRFYELVLEFQSKVTKKFNFKLDPQIPFRHQIDLFSLSTNFADLLDLTVRHGSGTLRSRAQELLNEGETNWRALLQSELVRSDLELLDRFFARACLQPVAEYLQSQLPADTNYSKGICPACDSLPQVAVLRPEGDGASRWLFCSLCLREWLFRRMVCPWCGEEDRDKLPRYSAEEYAQAHVEACDTCMRYLKAVDLSIDGHAEPLVDEAALAVLDVWAVDRGYTKIVPNLMGF